MEIFNTNWKVLIPLFEFPTKGLSIREISRLAKVSHPQVIKVVRILEKKKVIIVEKRKNGFRIKGNMENEKFIELKKLFNLLSLKDLVDYLREKYVPDAIICFGSFAEGTDIEISDIDIFVGYNKFKINEKELEKFERKLKRKIQIFSGNLSDFPKELRENIINGIKLYGWIKL